MRNPTLNPEAPLIERSPDGVTDWVEIGTTPANATVFLDDSSASLEGYYRVRAFNLIAHSGYSNTATAPSSANSIMFIISTAWHKYL